MRLSVGMTRNGRQRAAGSAVSAAGVRLWAGRRGAGGGGGGWGSIPKIFVVYTGSTLTYWLIIFPVQGGTWVLSPWVKRSGREAGNFPASSAEA
jgi:hypothetical protein